MTTIDIEGWHKAFNSFENKNGAELCNEKNNSTPFLFNFQLSNVFQTFINIEMSEKIVILIKPCQSGKTSVVLNAVSQVDDAIANQQSMDVCIRLFILQRVLEKVTKLLRQ